MLSVNEPCLQLLNFKFMLFSHGPKCYQMINIFELLVAIAGQQLTTKWAAWVHVKKKGLATRD